MVLRSESVGEQVAADQRGTFAGAAGSGPGAPAYFYVSLWWKHENALSYLSETHYPV